MGYLPPVRPWCSQNTRPSRYSFICPCSRTRLPERSSREVRLSFTASTRNLHLRPLGRRPLSWDSIPLQRVQTTGVHVLSFDRKATREDPKAQSRSTGSSHAADFGAAPRFSQPLSDLTPLAAPLPFSDRWRSWGCALQGFAPLTQPPAARRCQNTLMTLFPQVALIQS